MEPDDGKEQGRDAERRDAGSRRGDLARQARQAEDATFAGEEADGAGGGLDRIPGAGLVTGDLGPKGRIASRHRSLSRRASLDREEVPPGTTTPGTGRYLLATMLLLALGALGLALLIGWLAT